MVTRDLIDYGFFDQVPARELAIVTELGPPPYSPRPTLGEFAMRAWPGSDPRDAVMGLDIERAARFGADPVKVSWVPSGADLITLSSFSLGLWWCVGGPMWAGLLSILFDELDGRYARATGTTSERGAQLDFAADMTLTPLALMRLSQTMGFGPAYGLIASPMVLYSQATLKAEGYHPRFGSARAVVMLTAMGIQIVR
jgi:hypothetical protein